MYFMNWEIFTLKGKFIYYYLVYFDINSILYSKTRMSCQIKVNKNMEGCEIEIPRNAFAFFEKFNKDD